MMKKLSQRGCRYDTTSAGGFGLPQRGSTGGSTGDYLAKVEQYIAENIGESITRTQIANALFVSPGYIGSIIKNKLGCSCKELIVTRKMQHAKLLLHNTDLPIGEIAKSCGYDNFAYFSKVYKDYFGSSPSAERKSKP